MIDEPYTRVQLHNNWLKKIWDSNYIIWTGTTASGSTAQVRDYPYDRRGRPIPESKIKTHSILITDLASLSSVSSIVTGTVSVNNSLFPNIFGCVLTANLETSTFSRTTDIILKSAITINTAGGSARFLSMGAAGGTQVSSKTVAGGATGDLLDREIAVPKNTTIALGNGNVNDSWIVSYIDLGI